MVKYISLFSGIGGFEHEEIKPLLLCEKDVYCQQLLEEKYSDVRIVGEIQKIRKIPRAEYVVGGWPCQDLSSAGRLKGIRSDRSGLFFEMLRVAKRSGAHTLIGENVPNLLRINKGKDFEIVLEALRNEGYENISWRVLNARAFGLPQQRKRLFIVASTIKKKAEALHAKINGQKVESANRKAYGFYWTGGKRAICFSHGYAPALKIGAADEKGRAPVAVFYGDRIRKLTPSEFMKLQGFDNLPKTKMSNSNLLRMAGNAVPVPMGRFVLKSIFANEQMTGIKTSFGIIGQSGIMTEGLSWAIEHCPSAMADNLYDYLDLDNDSSLSAQASAGLIVRSVRSGNLMPKELFLALKKMTLNRKDKLRPSRSNSFEAMDSMGKEISVYERKLPPIDKYHCLEPSEE